MTSKRDILVLGTADWHQAIATNQHYAVRELSREHNVVFVQSMGLRKLEFSRRDLVRILKRLLGLFKKVSSAHRDAPPGVKIVSPVVLPLHSGLPARLNRILLRRQFRSWLDSPDRLLWTYTPITHGLAERAPTVYHCVDLLGKVDRIDASLVDRGERELLDCGARAAGSSPVVNDHLQKQGFHEPEYWPNVADIDVFGRVLPNGDRAGMVFAGNLTSSKVDFPLLETLIARGPLHIAGPISEGGGRDDEAVLRLQSLGATYHGLLDLDSLAELFSKCKVGLIPYLENDYTRGVSPLKTFEYLASGLAVVSTGVPSVIAVAAHVETCRTHDEFRASVAAMLDAPSSEDVTSERRRIAAEHSWRRRGEQMLELVNSTPRARTRHDARPSR